MRAGLIGAPIFLALAVIGFVLKPTGGNNDINDVSYLIFAIGLVLCGAMLILALAAWLLGRAQRRKSRAP